MHRLKQGGFSLIELTVAATILGVLLAIAIPFILDYVKDSKRADGVSVLAEAAQFMERNYSNSGRYDQDANGVALVLPTGLSAAPRGGGTVYYNLSFVAGSLSASTFTLQAVPVNSMASDVCGTLALTNTGVRSVSGTKSLDLCWRN